MAKQTHTFEYESFSESSDLDPTEQSLLAEALAAAATAYAPYSGFQVGCAVRLTDGTVVHGSNQENQAYPSGTCAERAALFAIGSQGRYEDVETIAVRAVCKAKPVKSPQAPCGACRQVMLETERLAGRQLTILLQGESGEILRIKGIAGALLPLEFDFDFT